MFNWSPENVSATRPAAAMIRTLIEGRELGAYLDQLPVLRVADVGSGFGRLAHVAALRNRQVDCFERNLGMVLLGGKLVPDATHVQADHLFDLPVDDRYYDLAYTFTVLQHMEDREAILVIEELKRIADYVLIVEDTDPRRRVVFEDGRHLSTGRSVGKYREAMQPFELIRLSLREVEPGFKRDGRRWRGVGHFMLFKRPEVEEIVTLDAMSNSVEVLT